MGLRVRLRLLKVVIRECKQTKRFRSDNSLSYLHNPGTEPLHYVTIGQLSSRAAQRWPDNEVFVSVQDSHRLTFSQADLQASKLAAGFLELGLVPGDRLGICSPNSTQWFLTAVAAAKAGLILVSMNPAYMKHDIEYCMQKVGIRAIVTDESYKAQNYYKMVCDIVPGLASMPVNSTISCNKLPDFSFLIINSEKPFPGAFRFCDVLDTTDSFQKLQEVNQKLRPDLNGNIQFTSGTTGKPKAVPLTHFNLVNNSYCFGKRIGMDKRHYKILAQSPFFHVLGYITALIASLNFGSTIVLPSPTFSVPDSSEAIKKEKCSMLVGTPTMYVDLCSYVTGLSPEEQLQHQSPEVAVSGGALCSPELFRKMKTTFSCDKVVSVYGLTETTAMCFQSTEEDSEYQMTSTVGKICEHVEAKVVGPDGKTVPMGEPGELWLRSFNNMAGYWEDPQGTENILTRDYWIKTGDKFVLTADGYGQVVGRIKDMIIRGGENISPKEVEDYLALHPKILEAQVYGVFSERLGEEVGCSLRLNPEAEISEKEVKDFCKDKIAYFKIPKYVEILKEFPKTGSGKIQKYKLRESMEKRLGIRK